MPIATDNEILIESLEEKRRKYLNKPSTKKYRQALQETRFHSLQFSLIQKRPRLLWELRASLPIFFWLVSHVNRDDGSTRKEVWAELDKLFKRGYLATVRHVEYMAKEFGCDPSTVSRALQSLEEYGFIQIERNYTWGSSAGGWHHTNLYILGYKEEEGEVWFYHTPAKEID